jgi:glutamate dehydrogenase
MGITARGAWEAVKRHFREMDRDIQTTPFTVVGVGDMSGDVFGNGMLLSPHDQAGRRLRPSRHLHRSRSRSGEELRRAQAAVRSAALELAGLRQGADLQGRRRVPRALKEIAAVGEARRALGWATSSDAARGDAPSSRRRSTCSGSAASAPMCAPSDETDAEVGDRANDAIRVTGAELRAKVIGEGANLGMTQRGRIEAALAAAAQHRRHRQFGRRQHLRRRGQHQDRAQRAGARGAADAEARNALLGEMTDEVAQLVLRNNYLQTLAISLAERRGLEDLGFQQRLMQTLESAGELDRAVEFLPDDMELASAAAAAQALTRPELSVLLAYAKIRSTASCSIPRAGRSPISAANCSAISRPSSQRFRMRWSITGCGARSSPRSSPIR